MDQLRKDLKETNKKLTDVTNKYEQLEMSNKELLAKSEPSRKPKRVKSWSEYCEKYKRKRIKKCADAVCTTFNDEGFIRI